MYIHTIFQSVLHDIFPWTVTFSTSNTTDKSLKVVLTRPNITKGVQIPRWTEITFLLPLNMPNVTNDICHFSVHIMGNKVDYGELPQFIFQPSIFKTALHKILKIIDDLPVCPGINDPAIIDILAERIELTSLYQVDSQSSIADGKIVKCIRTTKCSYIIPNESKVRCHECQGFLRSHRCLQKHPSPDSTPSKTAHDCHVNLSKLSRAELITRAKNLHKVVAQNQRKARRYYFLYQREKQKKVEAPKNYNPTSSGLGQLMNIALQNQWLTENSVFYALLTDTLTSLKRQEEEFLRHGNLTKSNQKPHPKGMRYNPLVIKWSCLIASKCHKRGYDVVRRILPIPAWETIKQYRQAASTTSPISHQNLAHMLQEMTRRGCKGVGGIHWDEMSVKEGKVLSKRTGESVGFEDLNINSELNLSPHDTENEDDNDENTSESSDSDSDADGIFSNEKPTNRSKKAKLICQFFYSSIEGNFSWPVASFPLQKLDHRALSSLFWQVCEAENGKKIEVIYGVSDGST